MPEDASLKRCFHSARLIIFAEVRMLESFRAVSLPESRNKGRSKSFKA